MSISSRKELSMTPTNQKHAELKRLSRQAKDCLFDMLKITSELIADHEYVEEFGGEAAFLELLEETEFSHFGGDPGLAAMLHAFRAFPQREQWEEYKMNVRAMIALARPAQDREPGKRTNWKAKCAELELRIAELEAENRTLRSLISQHAHAGAAA